MGTVAPLPLPRGAAGAGAAGAAPRAGPRAGGGVVAPRRAGAGLAGAAAPGVEITMPSGTFVGRMKISTRRFFSLPRLPAALGAMGRWSPQPLASPRASARPLARRTASTDHARLVESVQLSGLRVAVGPPARIG